MKENITETAQASLPTKKESSTPAFPAKRSQIRLCMQRPLPQRDSGVVRKAEHVSKEWSDEVSHVEQVSSHLSASSAVSVDLAPQRIQRFHLRKSASLIQGIAKLQDGRNKKIENKVSKLQKLSDQQKRENAQTEQWSDLIKSQEERQFQIGRITHYFNAFS